MKKPTDEIHEQAIGIATDLMTNGSLETAYRIVLEGPEPEKRDLGGRNFESVVMVIERHLRRLEKQRKESK